MSSIPLVVRVVAALLYMTSLSAGAAEFWTGPRLTFSKANSANPLLPENQDRVTDQIWITRGTSGGIFNARSESGYDFEGFTSPAGTEWAFNRTLAGGIEGVQFQPWALAANKNPPATVGVNAVMHLVAEDIYIDVTFTAWQVNCCGGFAYQRSTPPTPVEPVTATPVPMLPWPLTVLLGGMLAALAARSRNLRHRAH